MSLSDFLWLVGAASFAVGFPVLMLWLGQRANERAEQEWNERHFNKR